MSNSSIRCSELNCCIITEGSNVERCANIGTECCHNEGVQDQWVEYFLYTKLSISATIIIIRHQIDRGITSIESTIVETTVQVVRTTANQSDHI